MNKELIKAFKKKLFISIVIIIAIALFITIAFIFAKHYEVIKQEKKLNDLYMNKYDIELESLDFLTKEKKNTYKKYVVKACKAYDLKQLNKIVIDKESVKFNKEANMYEWVIYCNDNKNTSFLCAYKKSREDFSIERQYEKDIITVEEIEEKNAKKANTEGTFSSSGSKATGKYEVCKINSFVYPNDCKLLKTAKEKKIFEEGFKDFLGYEGIKSAKKIEFNNYNTYDGKTYDNQLVFKIYETAPDKINEVSAIYEDKEWKYGILY